MEKYIYYTNGELEMTEDECVEYHETWMHRLILFQHRGILVLSDDINFIVHKICCMSDKVCAD